MATLAQEFRHWTREEYERLVAEGFFQPEERLELVDGIIFEMSPQSPPHAVAIRLARRALEPIFSDSFDVLVQMPLALDEDSEPEPDLAVVRGRDPRQNLTSHPTEAALVIEVADSSLSRDREKASLYARVGISDYWIVNLKERCVEVSRDPQNGAYRSRSVLRAGDSVRPLARPEMPIAISDLLP
ncbi:MAG TPA: Uma2 family endonuclease [Thermoanaerobaculia bacterium]|jgi:Uma2 family endonuclease|nr:Uma2 family endonuclease [Thermoanaerobaculia bacterium]